MFFESPSDFMADFGSPVIFGAYTTMANMDRPDMDIMGGRVQSTAYRIEYPSTDLPGLGNGSQVLIGIGPGWSFDVSGTRLQYSGPSPATALSGLFRVIGTPNLLDDGTFIEANLERIS